MNTDGHGQGGELAVKGYLDDPLRHRWEHLRWLELKARMPEQEFVAFVAAERERREESRRLARRRVRPYLWHDGEKYYCMRELARLRGTTRANARDWARRRPSLCRWSTMAG